MYNSTLPSTSALDGGGWSTSRPGSFTPKKDPVPIVEEAVWAPGPVWTGEVNLVPPPHRDSIPRPSSPQRVAKTTELSRPLKIHNSSMKNLCFIHCRVHCTPPLIPILSHMNLIGSCTVQDCELMSHKFLLRHACLLRERMMCNLRSESIQKCHIYFDIYVTAI